DRTIPVPKHLRDSHYKGAARLGHGDGYEYVHDNPTGFADQDYLGVDKTYYVPTPRGYEKTIAEYLRWIESLRQESQEPNHQDAKDTKKEERQEAEPQRTQRSQRTNS